MPRTPTATPPVLEYTRPTGERAAGNGIGTIVRDFLCGSAVTSVIGSAGIAYYLMTRPGSSGLETFLASLVVVGVLILNAAMAGAVYAGASLKYHQSNSPVMVHPRRLMFYLGVAALPAGIAFSWVVGRLVVPGLFMGVPGQAAVASLPIGFITWCLTRPRG